MTEVNDVRALFKHWRKLGWADNGRAPVYETIADLIAELDRTRAELVAAIESDAESVAMYRRARDRAEAAEAALAAARAAMPTADVKDTIAWASGWCRIDMGSNRHDALRDWLARLDAYHAAPAAVRRGAP